MSKQGKSLQSFGSVVVGMKVRHKFFLNSFGKPLKGYIVGIRQDTDGAKIDVCSENRKLYTHLDANFSLSWENDSEEPTKRS